MSDTKINNYIIYGLFNPVSDCLRYVGFTSKSLEKRLEGHLMEIKGEAFGKWLKKLKDMDKTPNIKSIVKIPVGVEKLLVLDIERLLIHELSKSNSLFNKAFNSENPKYKTLRFSKYYPKMNNLKEIILNRGIKISWLAKKMDVTTSTLYNWCENRQQPNVTQLTKLKGILKVTYKELIQE